MENFGKVDREFFDAYIYPNLGADRDDVVIGPQHGVDFGVIDAGGRTIALSTDPVFLVPSLGWDRAAWFAFHVLLSDVAVSGLAPTHLSIDWNLPPEITDEEFEAVWSTFDREARDLGVAVVTGHTARYAGCNYPMVGGATAIGIGDRDDLVRPDGARVGDRVIVTKGPAIEATGLLAIQFESLLAGERTDAAERGAATRQPLSDETIAAAKDRFYDSSPVHDALVAAAAGPVTAIHDATEGGVYGGLYELAHAAGVRLEIDRDAIPVLPGVAETCAFFDMDLWSSISEGTLVITVEAGHAADVLAALEAEDVPAADAGEVVEGEGVFVDGDFVEYPAVDPFWAAFQNRLDASETDE